MPTLSNLATSNGSNLTAVATAAGVAVAYLQNVELGRQPLRLDIAKRIALELDVHITDVISAVPRITALTEPAIINPLPLPPGVPMRFEPIARAATQSASLASVEIAQEVTEFEGAQVVSIENTATVGFPDRNTPFSVGAWVKTSGTPTAHIIQRTNFFGGPDSGRGWGFNIKSDGKLAARFDHIEVTNGISVETAGSFDDGAWHFAVLTWAGNSDVSGLEIYVDDVAQSPTWTVFANTLTDTMIADGRPVEIGGSSQGTAFFVGQLDECSFYGAELSAAQVAKMRNGLSVVDLTTLNDPAPAILSGYWRMGEGASYPIIPDASANNNRGVMQNMQPTSLKPRIV